MKINNLPNSYSYYTFCTVKCNRFYTKCLFRPSNLNNIDKPIKMQDLNTELKAHGHPCSRKLRERGVQTSRNLLQTRAESKNHYLDSSFDKMNFFLFHLL
jgi:hypothetical protein